MQIFMTIARTLQMMLSAVVLGLSINLARHQVYGKVPSQTGYAAFTGALGVIATLVGIASISIASLRGVVTWVLDGLAGVALLAAGIVYAVALGTVNCDNTSAKPGLAWDNVLISGGCYFDKDGRKWCMDGHDGEYIHPRCVRAKADAAFMFLAFIACAVVLVASYMSRNR